MASPSTQPQPNGQSSTPLPVTTTTTAATTDRPSEQSLQVPLTSLTDDGTSKRPRDARLLHLVLSAQGINSYQERVPLQLLDFAYRYTSSVLSDSLRLASEGYTGGDASGRGRGKGGEEGSIGVTALRQAIASRQDFAFQTGGGLGKEFMLEQAAERNRVALPRVDRGVGLVLPEERYCLTGVGWGLKGEWESEEEEEEEAAEEGRKDVGMGGMDEDVDAERVDEGEEEEDEEGAGRMEDVFGEDGGGDADMREV